VNSSLYSLKRLSEDDDIHLFTCGNNEWDKDVADFLKEDAYTQQQMGLNVTLLCQKDNEIVGYMSLVSSALQLDESPGWIGKLGLIKIQRRVVPCILIAQFGVDSRYQRQGIGKFMLSWVRGAALQSYFGVKLLTIHVDRRNTVGRIFWESQGFVNFPPSGGNTHLFMVYDLY
jgi:GNAT superfamily N-acetyltransferase